MSSIEIKVPMQTDEHRERLKSSISSTSCSLQTNSSSSPSSSLTSIPTSSPTSANLSNSHSISHQSSETLARVESSNEAPAEEPHSSATESNRLERSNSCSQADAPTCALASVSSAAPTTSLSHENLTTSLIQPKLSKLEQEASSTSRLSANKKQEEQGSASRFFSSKLNTGSLWSLLSSSSSLVEQTDSNDSRPNQPEDQQDNNNKSFFGRVQFKRLQQPVNQNMQQESAQTQSKRVRFSLKYLGCAILHKNFTMPMLEWIAKDIKRQTIRGAQSTSQRQLTMPARDIVLEIQSAQLTGLSCKDGHCIFVHPMHCVSKYAQLQHDATCFSYLMRDTKESPSFCHVFQAKSAHKVHDIFCAVREAAAKKVHQPQQPISGGQVEPIDKRAPEKAAGAQFENSYQFEVMFVKKVKLQCRRVPASFVDDALETLKSFEPKKGPSQSGKRIISISVDERQEYDQEACQSPVGGERRGSSPQSGSGQSSEQQRESRSCQQSPTKASEEERHQSMDCLTIKKAGDLEVPAYTNDFSPYNTITSSDLNERIANIPVVSSSVSLDHETRQKLARQVRETIMATAASIKKAGENRLSSSSSSKALDSLSCTANSSLEERERTSWVTDKSSNQQVSQQPQQQNNFDLFRRASARQAVKNRTMLLLIGKDELCTISIDKHEMLFSRSFNSIVHCLAGQNNSDHFGLICRDSGKINPNAQSHAGFIFKCQSDKIVREIMAALKQVIYSSQHDFHGHNSPYNPMNSQDNKHEQARESRQSAYQNELISVGQSSGGQHKSVIKSMFCDNCPLYWYHRLCCDIESLPVEVAKAIILRRIDSSLPDGAQDELYSRFSEFTVETTSEHNDIFMSILRHLCERKQLRHNQSQAHLNAMALIKAPSRQSSLQRSESTSNQHQRSGSTGGSLAFVIGQSNEALGDAVDNLKKAKNSISVGIENILKRRGSMREAESEEPAPVTKSGSFRSASREARASDANLKRSQSTSDYTAQSTLNSWRDSLSRTIQDDLANNALVGLFRRRSSFGSKASLCEQSGSCERLNQNGASSSQPESPKQNNGSASPSSTLLSSAFWKKSIFDKIRQPEDQEQSSESAQTKSKDHEVPVEVKRSREELRLLWRKAIAEQITLLKMERQNQRIQDSNAQSGTQIQRLKLNYRDVVYGREVVALWDSLLRQNPTKKVDFMEVSRLVRLGIPKQRRGEIWMFLMNQYQLRHGNSFQPAQSEYNGDANQTYRSLLSLLSVQQHEIFVDIGRTFPSHPYYSQYLSIGQLSLFNLLKAYSLLDQEVGYCQGLSFVAGILLLHVDSEDEAFELMRHLLFNFGLRKQYLPSMNALHLQLYQMTRLLRDHEYQLFDHFDHYDISPSLYAAPWFLTLFASQFPLGFVARLLDLIFLIGIEAIFRVSLNLLTFHRSSILACTSLESTMHFMKNELVINDDKNLVRIFDKSMSLDLRNKLIEYEIEYTFYCAEDRARSTQALASKANNKSDTNSSLVGQQTDNRVESTSLVADATATIIIQHLLANNHLKSLRSNYSY